MSNRIAPAVRFVRSLDGKYYLLREAAQMLGISHRTLRNFNVKRPDELGARYYAMLGDVKVYLYQDEDIERIRQYLESQKTVYSSDEPAPITNRGRPAKWNDEQRKDRQRKFSKIHYYKRQAEKALRSNDHDKANAAVNKMREIQKQLRDQERELDASSR